MGRGGNSFPFFAHISQSTFVITFQHFINLGDNPSFSSCTLNYRKVTNTIQLQSTKIIYDKPIQGGPANETAKNIGPSAISRHLEMLNQKELHFYTLSYTINDGDTDQNETLPFSCTIRDQARNEAKVSRNIPISFIIDGSPPRMYRVYIAWTSHSPATVGTIINIRLLSENKEVGISPKSQYSTYDQASNQDVSNAMVSKFGGCFANGENVTQSWIDHGDGSYMVSYVVSEKKSEWKSGELTFACLLTDHAGNIALISQFTEKNSLEAR